MNNLTKHETVWLQAYCAVANAANSTYSDSSIRWADEAIKAFKDRFTPSPPPQKEADGVYVTRESLACAWNGTVWQPHLINGINHASKSFEFKKMCEALGLKP